MSLLISDKKAHFLYLLLTLVYVSGLFIPLMESDSAQHATMAMRMFLQDDFVNLYRGFDAYLDKPHMHFWLSGLSFKLFGISHWAYRLPALLFTLLGAISCYYLAKDLYGKQAAHPAALIFLSAQAIVLANHDVRTDAVLTGAVIFAVWQLVSYVNKEKLLNAILGGIGTAIAFSTKGQLAIVVIGSALLCYVLYNKKWSIILNWKTLVGLVSFFIACLPMLYAYHEQFGEKGIRFIFWDQSFNRLTGTGQHKANNTDYFFFFHTLLWAFLPWAVITYAAIFNKTKFFITSKFKFSKNHEFLTVGSFWLVMLMINMSKSKLPHYMNSLLPILAVLTSGYLVWLYKNGKSKVLNTLLKVQYFIAFAGSLGVIILLVTVFKLPSIVFLLMYVVLFGLLVLDIFKKDIQVTKIITVSVLFSVLANFCLNTYFYPNLLKYQAGNNAAKRIEKENILVEDVYILDKNYGWSLDFYTKRNTPKLELQNIKSNSGKWLFVYDEDLDKLNKEGIIFARKIEFPHFRVTRLSLKFLNTKTRNRQLKKAYLVLVK